MVRLCFMRKGNYHCERGYIADYPHNLPLYYLDPFIVVQVDETTIPAEWMTDETIRLDLNKLIAKYPDSTEQYVDENGNTQTRTIYGYFHEHGRSVVENCPVITINDVLRGE